MVLFRSKPGDGSYQACLANETRYSSLARKFPERAKELFEKSEAPARARFAHLEKLAEPYKQARRNPAPPAAVSPEAAAGVLENGVPPFLPCNPSRPAV